MYRPIPEQLKIMDSDIHGQGLFAVENIPGGVCLGITHIHPSGELYRTPLGGFVNHSDTPNCFILDSPVDSSLYTVRPIEEGEELTVYYRKYNV